MQQKGDDQWCPIAFFSKRLTPPKTRYSAFDRELLAVHLAIKHSQHFVEGQDFHIVADHKPLTFAIKSNHNHSPRQLRYLDFISQFTNYIRHVKGTENCVADALSRIEINIIHTNQCPIIDFAVIGAKQQDPELTQLDKSSLELQAMPIPATNAEVHCLKLIALVIQRW